jgi:ribosomal protein RSM22 (predicted rRNA methylase)
VELPPELRVALDEELQGLPAKKLAAVAADLSQRYRGGAPVSGGKFVQSPADATAYAAFRLPATFGASFSAFERVRERLPEWEPRSLADVGAGPGTASWAACTVWPDLQSITFFERDQGMIALGQRLAAHAEMPALAAATWRNVELAGAWESAPHDLVVAAYLLGELPETTLQGFIQRLWAMTGGVLVLIEPGTPGGFARIRGAREHLLVGGAHVIAPCPHHAPCPMAADNWCHFSQRVARSRLHRQIKGGELSYEDEKFSYVALSRMQAAQVRGRIIRHPHIQKGHVDLEICTPEGLTKISVTRRDKERFRLARDLRWGDVLPQDSD